MAFGGLVVVGLAVALVFAWCSRTPDAVRANEAIIAAVGVYPGGAEIERHHTPYNFRDGVSIISPAAGWSTSVTYRAPAGTTPEDILAFYDAVLDEEWVRRVDVTPIMEMSGEVPSASSTATPAPAVQVGTHEQVYFCRGESRLSVVTDNFDALGTFGLGVNASWAEPGYREC